MIPFESLVRQIKHDVGSYIFEHQQERQVLPSERPCAGDVNFDIQSVKMNVTTTFERGISGGGGLKVPIGLVTLEASGSASRMLSDTLSTTLTIWPLTAGPEAEFSGDNEDYKYQKLTAPPPPAPGFIGTPIRDALNQLRNDLVRTSDTAPCFDFGAGTQSNSVKWGFTVTDKAEMAAGFSIAVFSIGGQETISRVYANTIEASFIGSGNGLGFG